MRRWWMHAMDEVPTQRLRQGRYISLCTRNVSHSVESHVRKRRSRSTKQGTGPRCWTPIRYPQRPMGSQPSPSPRAATALAAAAEGHDLNFAGQPRGWTLAASASPSWSRAPVFVRRAAWGGRDDRRREVASRDPFGDEEARLFERDGIVLKTALFRVEGQHRHIVSPYIYT